MSDSQKSCAIQTHLENHRYIFSAILSFLSECDGTSTLITNKTWSRLVLPIYCIPLRLLMITEKKVNDSAVTREKTEGCSSLIHKKRHKFIVVPVQDPSVLLDRLNTTRLAKRLTMTRKGDTKSLKEMDRDNSNTYYPRCMTTDEIAWYEWNLCSKLKDNNKLPDSKIWPVTLELLRYRKPSFIRTLLPNQLHQSRPDILPGITLLASYPRSGNTLLRNLLERMLNVVTGSDTRPDRSLSKALALQHNLVGEGIASPSITPIIKTHFPERRGCKVFNASRVILLVRNPYDAIDSYWNMCCTNTHTESVVEDVYKVYAEKFRGLARSEIRTWMDFLKYYTIDDDVVEKTRLPTLIVRYEDLILHTKSVMEEVMKFLLYGDHVEGKSLHPFWRWRVHHSLDVAPNTSSDAPLHQTGERVDASVGKSKGDNPVVKDNLGIDTMALGSYKPRPMLENGFEMAQNSTKGSICLRSPKNEQSESFNRGTLCSIGKSLKKNRYSDGTIQHFHDVASEKKYLIGKGDNPTTWLRLFGYDILSDHFPLNFARDGGGNCLPSLLLGDPKNSTIRVNVGQEIRPSNDPFGRAMTNWRRGETDEDREPFLTLQTRSIARCTDGKTRVKTI